MEKKEELSGVDLEHKKPIDMEESRFCFGLLLKTALFTFIVGIIATICAEPFGLLILKSIAMVLFFTAFICVVLQIMIWIFGSIRDYSLLVKTLITTTIVGGFFMLGYTLFLIPELRMSGLISFGVGIIALIFKIFQLIFLRK
jgi:hypothetical protein